MDFMKVIDQTVREIKREVNLKVLKIPEIEQKVLDATSDEPWGPHGSALQEIAQASKKFAEGQMIMGVLWTRLAETDRNWRHVYKALAVIEYLVANGSQRAVDEIIDHSYQISTLSGFEYVEPNGKDMGINVRKKVETILGLLNSKDKIQEVRNKAAANRDKYVGVSSTGITYKSSSASYGSGRFQHSDRYGGFGSSMENVYKDRDRHGDASDWNRDEKPESKSDIGHENVGRNSKREPTRRVTSKASAKVSYSGDNSGHIPSPPNNIEDEDDFDPRGSSTKAPGTNQVDLFGGSLIDLMDAPTSVTIGANASNNNVLPEVDLFADAAFVSALPHEEAKGGANIQASVNLFAQQSNSPAFSSPVDLFGSPIPSLVTEKKSANSDSTDPNTFDPFATTPTNNLDGPAVFGDFTSFTKPTHNNVNEDLRSPDQQITTESDPQLKKDTFQVKSKIWADSLSRGLIDLSISAPKKISLPEIGIVGGLSDESEEKDKRLPAPAYTGRSMQIGLGMDSAGFTSTTPTGIGGNADFGSRGYQFGNFK